MFGIYFKTKSTFQTIKSSLYGLTRTTSTNENSESHRSLLYTSPQTWKRSALWFLIFSGGLAFNGIAFLQPAEPEIMSRIFLISALLWLIGTTAILYIVLRNEEVNRSKMEKLDKETEKKGRYKITKSEKN